MIVFVVSSSNEDNNKYLFLYKEQFHSYQDGHIVSQLHEVWVRLQVSSFHSWCREDVSSNGTSENRHLTAALLSHHWMPLNLAPHH